MAKVKTPVGLVALSDLLPDEKNANRGTKRGAALIKKSLKDYGAGRSILLDKNNRVIAGNKTLEQAGSSGIKGVRVIESDGTQLIAVKRTDLDLKKDAKAKSLAIADNRAGELSLEWDSEILKGLNEEIDIGEFFNGDELAALLGTGKELLTDEDEVPPVPKKPKTKRGQIYQLGAHRLMCGDSTDEDSVRRLMNGEIAGLMNTDPPYGVSLRLEDNHAASNSAKGIKKNYRHFEKIMGDDLDGPQLQEFLERVFAVAIPLLRDNAAWYLWHAQLTQGFFAAAAAAQLLVHRQIIWAKPHFVFGRGDYHWQHELCFYGWRQGKRPPFYGERNQSTVWQLTEGGGSIRKEQDHPTQKPVELFVRPIENHLKAGEICYEPFCGSGSQVIAAEKTGRRCFAMELGPLYCDVIIARWEAATGQKAVKVG